MHGVLVGGVGQFVGERVNGKRVIDVGNAAQPTDAYMGVGGSILGAMIRNVEWQVVPAQAHFIISVLGVHIEGGADRRIGGALQPGRRLAVRSNRRLHIHGGDRVEEVELDVVFTGPDNLHWLAELFRENGCFRDLVGF